MLDPTALARAAASLGLPFAACRLDVTVDDVTARPGMERATGRVHLAKIAQELAEPSGWLWGDAGLVRVTDREALMHYDGIVFAAEIGAGATSVHLRALPDATWRVTTYRETQGSDPTHLVETIALLGASLRELPDLVGARLHYRRYWQASPDDRSRPVAVRLVDLR